MASEKLWNLDLGYSDLGHCSVFRFELLWTLPQVTTSCRTCHV